MKYTRLTRAAFLTCLCMIGTLSPAMAQTAEDPVPAVVPSGDVSPAVEASGAPFSGLFKDSIRDLKRLPSQDSLKWLGIGAALAVMGHPLDDRTSDGLSASVPLDSVFEPGKTIGGARGQLAGALATYALGRVTRSPKITLLGTDLLQAQLLSQAFTAAVKVTAKRTRPDGDPYSFPSGHSSVTFASATVLQRNLGWKVGIPAYGVATYVATSRIQEKRHFLSDVAFGAAIGIIAGRSVTVGRGDRRFAVGPLATAGGGGVSFTLVGQQ